MSRTDTAQLTLSHDNENALVADLGGCWRLESSLPGLNELSQRLQTGAVKRVVFRGKGISAWDSTLLAFLVKAAETCHQAGLSLDFRDFPDGVERLLKLTQTPPQTSSAPTKTESDHLLVRLGTITINIHRNWLNGLEFAGELSSSLLKLVRGKVHFRRKDFLLLLEGAGAQALPIVTLISVLVGMILAFVGAVQLRQFGAGLFVADLVGLGMAREMAAMMTAVIIAGRTGAAFAAQLGTMQVNEEIDALRTFGISPMEFLVLPRMLALIVMMPLLTIYSAFLGVLGGGIVSALMLGIGLQAYFLRIQESVGLDHFLIGVAKAAVFGVVVAMAGCMRGMQCGRSAQAVGQATTAAVVSAIVWIVVCDAIITLLCQTFGI
ncbi:MAG: hypothetical protein C0616_10355 [Desulfuromonas sp.]|nr:MAG: hypothetical protein C0616_10355 [Desulfuromonas sp.]